MEFAMLSLPRRKITDRKILRDFFISFVLPQPQPPRVVSFSEEFLRQSQTAIASLSAFLTRKVREWTRASAFPISAKWTNLPELVAIINFFVPREAALKVMRGQTISVGNSYNRHCRFRLPIWRGGQWGRPRQRPGYAAHSAWNLMHNSVYSLLNAQLRLGDFSLFLFSFPFPFLRSYNLFFFPDVANIMSDITCASQ